MSAYKRLRAVGFKVERTGGNCTALVRRYPDGLAHYITLEGDPMAPTLAPDTARVTVGLFKDGEFEPVADEFTDELRNVAAEFGA